MLKILNLGNKGEVNAPPDEPSTEPDVEPGEPPAAPSEFDTLMSQKGFKSNDDVAKSYREAESTLHRTQNTFSTVKQQLESHGYTVDDKGNIISDPNQQSPYGQPNQQLPGQTYQQDQYNQYGNQQQEPIYDPYTGQQITNQIDAQLAQMPLSQRMAFVYNAMADQREKQQRDSFNAEQEVLSSEGAKGFEDDVRRVMQQVPLAQRTKKESWKDALLKVKGMKYDDAIRNASQQGVDNFLNKEGIQSIPAGQGTGEGSVKLTAQQEQTYKWYQDNHPGMFKDRKHFASRLSSTGN